MRRNAVRAVLLVLALPALAADPAPAPGGGATVPAIAGPDVLRQPAADLAPERDMDFRLGQALFRKLWVAAPASTRGSDGLGPLYNARSCESCHIGDGRGHAPAGPEDSRISMVLRLSVPGGTTPGAIADWLATQPEPVYGRQLQDQAAPGRAAEGRLVVEYDPLPVVLGDGSTVTLRAPRYGVADPAFGPMAADVRMSPRIAPPMTGLGLLEAIPEAAILGRADPQDADGDGISGRAAWLPGPGGQPVLGRFGWKAGMASLRDQTAAALADDMGLSNPLHRDPWGDCTAAEVDCRAGPHGQDPGIRDGLELDGQALDLLVFYAANLGVPARRNAGGAEVQTGEALFAAAGCGACHVPRQDLPEGARGPGAPAQAIWPYTDLLLHDMGEGLADNRPEGVATGREWRTPPLWGIGLAAQVSPEAGFLHDGRARSLAEAILWHGGEATAARDAFAAMPAADRAALLTFLESL